MVANNPKHMLGVFLISRKCAQFPRDFRRGCIGHACQDRGQCRTQGAAFGAVISQTKVHEQTADIGIAQTKRPEIKGPLCNFFGWELRHHDGNFQCQRPQTDRMRVLIRLEHALFQECQKVHRRKVTRRIVQEHIFRTGV